jgi:predicted ABC-type ATPase
MLQDRLVENTVQTSVPSPPQAVIIAGPNGSGKSTAATQLLSDEMVFVNADMIAQEITGLKGTSADINAGRLLLDQVERLETAAQDFAFETTLATKILTTRVKGWRERGFQVHLIYFWLPSDDMCVLRVQGRVRDGGHDVPEETIRRRYAAGLRLFFGNYRHLVDTWRLYDNSGGHAPAMIARGDVSGSCKVFNEPVWNQLLEEFGR